MNRAGDNLYSASVLALDPDTGKLKWYYQFTPHDVHDWDSTQNPVLVETEFLGQTRKVLAWPNRNGFFYLIDRTNGKFLSATAFVKQTWNDGFDYENNGRPKLLPGMDPTPDGNEKVWPGIDGAANWMSHSYSPLTKCFIPSHARNGARIQERPCRSPPQRRGRRKGQQRLRCSAAAAGWPSPAIRAGRELGKAIAIDLETGAIKWEHRVLSPPWGGLMSTAGNVVFGGTIQGVIFALNATTGERLWTLRATAPCTEPRLAILLTASSSCRFLPATSSSRSGWTNS